MTPSRLAHDLARPIAQEPGAVLSGAGWDGRNFQLSHKRRLYVAVFHTLDADILLGTLVDSGRESLKTRQVAIVAELVDTDVVILIACIGEQYYVIAPDDIEPEIMRFAHNFATDRNYLTVGGRRKDASGIVSGLARGPTLVGGTHCGEKHKGH